MTQEYDPQDYSIETPAPAEFLPYDPNQGGAVTASHNDIPEHDDDENQHVRHGRSPRFYMILVGAFVVIAVAVGAGVGVAMSGGGGSSETSAAAATSSSVSSNGKQNKQTVNPGDNVVDLGLVAGDDTSTNEDMTEAPNSSEVFDIILTHASFHGVEFENPNSYQSKSAKWVESVVQLGEHTPTRIAQLYALACIYHASNGVANKYTAEIFGEGNEVRGWIDETGWLAEEDECTWHGITCDDDGNVVAIELYKNRLTGQFPPEVAILKHTLQVIDLFQNSVYNKGEVGNHWIGELTNLRKLFFGKTYFEYDGIPSRFAALSNLEEFDCSYSLYHGPLRGDVFSHMPNLAYLHLGGNSYNSSIPSELAALPSLQFFYAEYTDLTGDISFIPEMKSIVELWVDKNPKLTGPIPSEIGNLESLQSLSLTQNGLTGTVPPELSNLGLSQLWLYGNQLTGSMPGEVCSTRYPDGKLMTLEADCSEVFTCSCCTCCGDSCSN